MEEKYNITLDLNVIQEGTIKVHSQIINDLSSGIYSSPASCIKELVNNSYDADSSLVNIRIKPIDDTIIVIDNGNGMNAIEFDENFAWISRSNKRNSGEFSPRFNRPLIGKIGIGFIAVNEICHSMKVISSKAGEKVKFEATIDFDDIISDNSSDEIIKGKYTLVNAEEEEDIHYTIIELIQLKESVIDILNDKQYYSQVARFKNEDFDNYVFSSMKEILIHHGKKKLKTFKEENAYTQFILDLASYIPVEYIEGGPINGHTDDVLSEIVNHHKKLKFKVDLDGIFLKKPIYFDITDGKKFACISFQKTLKIDETKNNELKFKGYFFALDHLLTPRELNGVSVRIKGIPIAVEFGYDTTLMAYPNYVDQIFRNWISGEIYIEKGLEDAMNIDRKSFRVTHPHYLKLQNFVHQYLREYFFSKDVLKIYKSNKSIRDKAKEQENNQKKQKLLKSEKVEITIVQTKETESNKKINPIEITREGNKTKVEIDDKFRKKFRKSDWDSIEDILIIFEKAYEESNGDVDKLKESFYKLIITLKSK